MSFYGSKQNLNLYGIHKHKVDANTSHRFGGAHGILAYNQLDGSPVDAVYDSSGVHIVTATDSDVVVIILMGLNPNASTTFNAQVVVVDGSYNIPVNTHAAVIGGTLNSLDGESNIHFIQPSQAEITVSGIGKLLTLTYTEDVQ